MESSGVMHHTVGALTHVGNSDNNSTLNNREAIIARFSKG